MNIFILSLLTKKCAQQHIDAHVRKMIIEYAQLLSTAHRIIDGKEVIELSTSGRKTKRWVLNNELDKILYKSTHVNHPCAIWVRESVVNYAWLYSLFVELCKEYTYRFKKIHLTDSKLRNELKNFPKNIPLKSFTPFPLAMPDIYKRNNCTTSYKLFYVKEKQRMANGKLMNFWTNRDQPKWIRSLLIK